jgi:hypothetical protein
MKRILTTALATLIASVAWAGPDGSYTVSGTNPGGGGAYKGTVNVTRTGETYEVIWDIAGTRFTGSGLGAAPVKGQSVMGRADDNDNTLAVGYVSGPSNFGLAFYVEQPDGTWQGIWTYGGSDRIGTEVWQRR